MFVMCSPLNPSCKLQRLAHRQYTHTSKKTILHHCHSETVYICSGYDLVICNMCMRKECKGGRMMRKQWPCGEAKLGSGLACRGRWWADGVWVWGRGLADKLISCRWEGEKMSRKVAEVVSLWAHEWRETGSPIRWALEPCYFQVKHEILYFCLLSASNFDL